MLLSILGLLTLGGMAFLLLRYREESLEVSAKLDRHMQWHAQVALNKPSEPVPLPKKKPAPKKKGVKA